ncbi:hypothetical protein [Chitinophaga sancti]|uniref:Uncharacterized protein n=1 Tax=Chitinophaga sancti TaxID=1004 RepID=A0A1K1SUZ5_9BACT|nr:hypothetical protein [Chitinophaga sancti]WQD60834.1 hypothetical protein U0033_23330 [Chitinophaga sancti]WQG87038.1 hypothetical protein SR876_19140 [Chitinophaga sancti]SFW87677.1 hypothetical protein SAMN05661012_06111 [Chitinophaga sancti]
MEENRAVILSESQRTVSKLQLLSTFFEDEIIYKIFLRTQVIHKLFENNTDLNVNKLELFHVQYSLTIIELLRKIKIANERNVLILHDEIQLNRDLIDKLNSNVFTEQSYNLEKQRQALKVNQSLRRLFQLLSEEKDESPFSKNINAFSARFAADFFFDIPFDLVEKITDYNPAEVYRNAYATIHRKLLGILNKVEFKSEFYCGLTAGSLIMEVYHIVGVDRYFLFVPSRNLFLFIELADLSGIDLHNNISKKAKIIQEIADKNDQLLSTASVVKTQIPPDIKKLISDYHNKIDDVNFLQNLSDVDIEANILKAMLNTDSL